MCALIHLIMCAFSTYCHSSDRALILGCGLVIVIFRHGSLILGRALGKLYSGLLVVAVDVFSQQWYHKGEHN